MDHSLSLVLFFLYYSTRLALLQGLFVLNFRDLPDRSVVDEEGILPRIHVIHIKAIDLPLVEKERQGFAPNARTAFR